jgi:hypothetical protein
MHSTACAAWTANDIHKGAPFICNSAISHLIGTPAVPPPFIVEAEAFLK